mgnify:CR=1 FL=1
MNRLSYFMDEWLNELWLAVIKENRRLRLVYKKAVGIWIRNRFDVRTTLSYVINHDHMFMGFGIFRIFHNDEEDCDHLAWLV